MAAIVRPRPARFRTTLATAPRRPRQRLVAAAARIRRRHPTAAAATSATAPNMPEWWLAGLLVLITAAAGLASLAQWLHLA